MQDIEKAQRARELKTQMGRAQPHKKIKDIAVIAMMSSILFAVQVGLAFIPNIELVSLLIIVYTLVFGYKAFFIIYIFVVLEGLLYGFGTWWIAYLYVWAVLALITLIFRKVQSPFVWGFISGIYGLSFGFLCSLVFLFIGGPSMVFAYWINGIPFDIIHCAGNFFVALVLIKPARYI